MHLDSIDISVLPGEERQASAVAVSDEQARRPLDLQNGPLLSVTLL
ncbi:hypothetical protein [Pseudomonas syringae group genomosp. 7]